MTNGVQVTVSERPTADGPAVPRHVGIIMDGNGRWARARGLPRTEGHRRGMQTVREIITHADKLGIGYLTLFAFSSENWSRPADEVGDLMLLLKVFIRRDLRKLHEQNVRIRILGERDSTPGDVLALLLEAEELTANNNGLTLAVAFNYGARNEMLRAFRQLAADVAAGRRDPKSICEADVAAALDTAQMPDPDLIIRTSGEQRLSNFLLWQAAYTEFVFVKTHWPDFDADAFDAALDEFYHRDRRFGGLSVRVGS